MIPDAASIDRWISKNRFRFLDYGQWLIGHEPNTCDPITYDTSALRVLVVRLSSYSYVASSMSHGLLAQITRKVEKTFVDFCFMPLPWEARIFAEGKIPPLFGVTSKRPCTDFDVIAVSNSVAQEIVNLSWMLSRSGIPLSIEERLAIPKMPIIILGGANAQSAFIACTSKPGTGKSLVDALYFGEAETAWETILEYCIDSKGLGYSKLEMLRGLKNEFPRLHIPLPSDEVAPRESARHAPAKPPEPALPRKSETRSLIAGPVWYDEETLGYSSIATDYGCPYLCRFCKEAWERRPYRTRKLHAVIEDISEAKMNMGLDTVNLFSFNFTSHPDATFILEAAKPIVRNIQIKSQRFDGLLDNPSVYEYLSSIGKTSFTFGLEGVSSRIRRFFRKNIDEQNVCESLRIIFNGAIRQVKIFLIISGLEDDLDLEEFSILTEKIAKIRDSGKNRHAPVVLSVTPLIPMPHTPLEFAPFPNESVYFSVMKSLDAIVRRHSMILRESVSLGEARAALFLLFSDADQSDCINNTGFEEVYNQSLPKSALKTFTECAKKEWKDFVLNEKDGSASFPWDVMCSAEEKNKLFLQYTDAKTELSIRQSGKEERQIKGGSMGGANLIAGLGVSSRPRTSPIDHGKVEPYLFWFGIESDERLAGVSGKFLQVALARSLMLEDSRLVSAYIRPGKAASDIDVLPVYGTTFVSLEFKDLFSKVLEVAIHKLNTTWGFSVKSMLHYELGFDPRFALVEYDNEEPWNDRFIYDMLNKMNRDSVAYDIIKTEGKKSIIIGKPSLKKAGCRSLVWDFLANKLFIVIDTNKESGRYIAGSMLKGLWYERGKPWKIVRWLQKFDGGKCEKCGSSQSFEAMDSGFAKSMLCGVCLGEQNYSPTV